MGTLDLMWKGLAPAITRQTGNVFRTYPLGNGGGPEWLDAVQKQYAAASTALGLPPPPDLQSYDLKQPADWASWTFILGQTTRSIQIAAGVP